MSVYDKYHSQIIVAYPNLHTPPNVAQSNLPLDLEIGAAAPVPKKSYINLRTQFYF